jgi:hypothetical protein
MNDETGCRTLTDRKGGKRTIHRTRPIRNGRNNLLGHKCECGRIYTPAGNASREQKVRADGRTVAPNKSHKARVKWSRKRLLLNKEAA